MLDVLLVNTSVYATEEENPYIYELLGSIPNKEYHKMFCFEHLEFAYLSRILKDDGLSVRILDLCLEQIRKKSVLKRISRELPTKVLALSVYEVTYDQAILISDFVKELYPDTIIVAGGDAVSNNPCGWLGEFCKIDALIVGENELQAARIIQQAVRERNINYNEPGMAYYADGKVRFTPFSKTVDIDVLPFPARLQTVQSIRLGGSAGVMASRGCNYAKCRFCAVAQRYKDNRKCRWKTRNAESLVTEILQIADEFGDHFISFVDEDFVGGSSGAKRVKDFVRLLASENSRINFSIACRAVDVTQNMDLFESLAYVGLSIAFVGFESSLDHKLLYYNKGSTGKHNRRSLEFLLKLGVKVVPGMIFFDPVTSAEDLRQEVDFVRKSNFYAVNWFTKRLRMLINSPFHQKLKVSAEALAEVNHQEIFSEEWRSLVYTAWSDAESIIRKARTGFSAWNAPEVFDEIKNLHYRFIYGTLERFWNAKEVGNHKASLENGLKILREKIK